MNHKDQNDFKNTVEKQIAFLLLDFENKTGASVESVDLISTETTTIGSQEREYITAVRINALEPRSRRWVVA